MIDFPSAIDTVPFAINASGQVVGLYTTTDGEIHGFFRAFSHGIKFSFRSKVTFFVGENGSGKSTLLEALAECCGFNPEGGNRDRERTVANRFTNNPTENPLFLCSPIASSRESTSWMSRRRRFRRNDSCRSSGSSTTSRHLGMRNSSSRLTRPLS
jgi:probable HAF family extracellular repeat protein